MMQSDSGPHARGASTLSLTAAGADAPGGGAVATAIPLARAPPLPGVADLTADEWDGLFQAVRSRLEQTVATLAIPAGDEAATRAGIDMHECVEALGQLQVLRRPERDHCFQLELQVLDLRSALALALNELVEVAARAAVAGASARTMNDR